MFINNHKKQIRLLCRVLFALYIAGLVYFLFFAEMLDRTGIERSYRYNLIPFREIRRFIVYADLLGPMAVISNLFGNIVIFMPFGFSGPDPGQKKTELWFTSLLSFALSLAVECIQLVTRTGCFDVDDIFSEYNRWNCWGIWSMHWCSGRETGMPMPEGWKKDHKFFQTVGACEVCRRGNADIFCGACE